MTLNLMPAELVAKIADDHWLETYPFPTLEPRDEPPNNFWVDCVRHAWIVAAEALEERADEFAKDYYGARLSGERELRAAARALRQAAREDVEP